jgi:hypothetical protein
MLTIHSPRSIIRRVATVSCLAVTLLLAGVSAFAQSNESASDNGLGGAWFVQVTLRNCDTQAPMGSFNSLVAFHRGGTLSETTVSPAFAIGQRTPGTGVWEATGHHTYTQHVVALIGFDTAPNLPGTPGFNPAWPVTPGFFAGWSTITHTLTMRGADRVESEGTNAFYKADGTLYRTGCSTSVGTRFQ